MIEIEEKTEDRIKLRITPTETEEYSIAESKDSGIFYIVENQDILDYSSGERIKFILLDFDMLSNDFILNKIDEPRSVLISTSKAILEEEGLIKMFYCEMPLNKTSRDIETIYVCLTPKMNVEDILALDPQCKIFMSDDKYIFYSTNLNVIKAMQIGYLIHIKEDYYEE